jgi:hypothetical protein
MGNAVLTHGLDTDAATLREFLSLAGAPNVGDGPLPEDVAGGVRCAQGARLPGEPNVALDALRQARIPSVVASGKHSQELERICDALAGALDAERLIAPGAGHLVAAAPNFADRLEQFLISADEGSPQPAPRD